MIVVTTPTGHIGSYLVRNLLAAGEPVRVIARDPGKVAPGLRDKLEVVQGSSDDETVLAKALDGAESLFFVVPPSFAAPDVVAYYLRFARAAAVAAKATGVRRIVSVSGIGAHSKLDAGLVSAALAAGEELDRSGIAHRALWCPGFMENMLMSLPTLAARGVFYGASDAEKKRPMVATRDIAAVGAKLLRDRSWSGPGGVAVLGPADISMNEMAATLGDVLGRPIRYERISLEAQRAQLEKYGASPDIARAFVQMVNAKDDGLDDTEPRTADSTTPTTFRQFCEEVLAPALTPLFGASDVPR